MRGRIESLGTRFRVERFPTQHLPFRTGLRARLDAIARCVVSTKPTGRTTRGTIRERECNYYQQPRVTHFQHLYNSCFDGDTLISSRKEVHAVFLYDYKCTDACRSVIQRWRL